MNYSCHSNKLSKIGRNLLVREPGNKRERREKERERVRKHNKKVRVRGDGEQGRETKRERGALKQETCILCAQEVRNSPWENFLTTAEALCMRGCLCSAQVSQGILFYAHFNATLSGVPFPASFLGILVSSWQSLVGEDRDVLMFLCFHPIYHILKAVEYGEGVLFISWYLAFSWGLCI